MPAGNADTLGDGVTRGDHQVVASEIELADRPGVERQQLSVVIRRAGERVQGTRRDSQRVDRAGGRTGRMEQRVEIGIGMATRQVVEHALAAAQSGEPIVYERDLQRPQSSKSEARSGRAPNGEAETTPVARVIECVDRRAFENV